jgi:hypothetical protein
MKPSVTQPLRTHLADFETTISHLLRRREARALLNFAVLFHEYVYLTDTALGDHQFIIEGFQQEGYSGLLHNVLHLAQKGILRVLCRDKVVVREKVLVARNPTLRETFEGWQYRDKYEWSGETGFTTRVDQQVRVAYYREVDEALASCGAIQRYDPDIPKAKFRDRVREQLNRERPSMLVKSLDNLPAEIRRKYYEAIEDPWFTNAELWRVLRRAPGANEAIILHAHINQQCFADITNGGISEHDRSVNSLASFNLELQYHRPWALEVEATLEPPKSLMALLERAPVRLQSSDIEMFGQLSVEKIIELRRRARPLFDLASRKAEAPHKLEDLRLAYLKALEKYWGCIIETFEAMYPHKMFQRSHAGLFTEDQLPTLTRIYRKYRRVFALLLRIKLPPPFSDIADQALEEANHVGFLLLSERSPANKRLRSAVPPTKWHPRGILGLDRVSANP